MSKQLQEKSHEKEQRGNQSNSCCRAGNLFVVRPTGLRISAWRGLNWCSPLTPRFNITLMYDKGVPSNCPLLCRETSASKTAVRLTVVVLPVNTGLRLFQVYAEPINLQKNIIFCRLYGKKRRPAFSAGKLYTRGEHNMNIHMIHIQTLYA